MTGDETISQLDIQTLAYNRTVTTHLWQNPDNRFDVDHSGGLSPLDALVVANTLNAWGPTLLDFPRGSNGFLDVSGDNVLSSLDFAQIIDKLNGRSGDVGATWRNSANPFDVTGDGVVDDHDEFAVSDYLDSAVGQTWPFAPAEVQEVRVRSHGGNDLLTARVAPASLPVGLFGGAGDDSLRGSVGGDFLRGGPGHDMLDGVDGDDELFGDEGDDELYGGPGEDKLYGGPGNNTLDGGPGYDVVDPSGPHSEGFEEQRFLRVALDMSRIADVIYDERHVKVTLEGPGGFAMRELRSLIATASFTGDTDPTVVFPIPDPYTEYGVTVTASDGLTVSDGPRGDDGGLPFPFHSSHVGYDLNGVFELPYVILSTGDNYGPGGEDPYPGYVPPYVDPPLVIAQNDWWRDNTDPEACRYCTISGGTLEVDAEHGVLANDYSGTQYWPAAQLTAQIVDPPAHGTVHLHEDGSFTYIANPGFWGQDFFRYKASDGQHRSLTGTVYVQVASVQELVVSFYVYTPNISNSYGNAAQWVAHYLKDSATREKKSVNITVYLNELKNQTQLDQWNNKVGLKELRIPGKRYVIVTITVDDKLSAIKGIGYTPVANGADFRVTMNPSNLKSEYEAVKGALLGPDRWGYFMGTILTHEGIYHGIKATHFYNFVHECGCIDAHTQPYNGGRRFSNEASTTIWPKLGIKS